MDSEEHTANGALCALVSRGQALLCELLRLSDRVPPPFRPAAAAKHAAVLFDFAYLKARCVRCAERACAAVRRALLCVRVRMRSATLPRQRCPSTARACARRCAAQRTQRTLRLRRPPPSSLAAWRR